MRRSLTAVLTLFYLLQATWLLHAGVDLLMPRVVEVVVKTEDCCTRRCGCPDEVQARKSCCCFPGKDAGAQAPAQKVPVSAIEEARCRGLEDAMAQASTQPKLCDFPAFPGPVPDPGVFETTDVVPFLEIHASPPDKVPLV